MMVSILLITFIDNLFKLIPVYQFSFFVLLINEAMQMLLCINLHFFWQQIHLCELISNA